MKPLVFTADSGPAASSCFSSTTARVPKPAAAWAMLMDLEDLYPNDLEKLHQEQMRVTLLIPSPPSPEGAPYTSQVHLWPQGRRGAQNTHSKIKLDQDQQVLVGWVKELVISERQRSCSGQVSKECHNQRWFSAGQPQLSWVWGADGQTQPSHVLQTLLLTLPPLRTGISGDF